MPALACTTLIRKEYEENMERCEIDNLAEKNGEFGMYYGHRANEMGKSMGTLSKVSNNKDGQRGILSKSGSNKIGRSNDGRSSDELNDGRNDGRNDERNDENKEDSFGNAKNSERDLIALSEDNPSSLENIFHGNSSQISLYEGYKTNYIVESLFDKTSFIYFMVPFNKYSYTNYYTNWNKVSFRMYASLNSSKGKSYRKKRKKKGTRIIDRDDIYGDDIDINDNVRREIDRISDAIYFPVNTIKDSVDDKNYASYVVSKEEYFSERDENLHNPLISIMNNFLYFLLLSEFLSYNELFKLMPLCRCSYDIFNACFYINVHINPFKQSVKDIISFLKENKEYQFCVLINSNYGMDKKKNVKKKESNLYINKNELPISDSVNFEGEKIIERKNLLHNTKKYSTTNGILFTNNIISIRYFFSVYEFKRIFLSKMNREKIHFNIYDKKFKLEKKKKNSYFDYVLPYGNKVCSLEYKVKLKKHIQRRWNLKGNYVHENFFHHISDGYEDHAKTFEGESYTKPNGVLKLVENTQSRLYPCFTSFLSMDKSGYINVWKIDDVNSLIPTRVHRAQLTLDRESRVHATDSLNLGGDRFLLSDMYSLYLFILEGKHVSIGSRHATSLLVTHRLFSSRAYVRSYTRTCAQARKRELNLSKIINLGTNSGLIKNISRNDRNKCTVGMDKAICFRVDIEKGKIESSKKNMEDLQKINCFDNNTNIILSKKSILIDDSRISTYVSYVNYYMIDYENDKKYSNTENYFCDLSLTGISLTSQNSNSSIFLFDLRYNYPSTCLYYENVITNTYRLTGKEKLTYLHNLKTHYNSLYYLNRKKYSGFHDNILLYPHLASNLDEVKTQQDNYNYVKNKIHSDESFIYSIVREEKKKVLENLPTSYLNMWRWCDKRQFKTFFHYNQGENYQRKWTGLDSSCDREYFPYVPMQFDSVYKFVEAPNHLFLTYEHSNYIHSLLAPSYGMELKSSLKEVPFHVHPTNL
ncbi:conserved Plasmodium protein, unknown function [Plasmodium ovale wallikeri]|uniref:Uncharacterized protein n=1 Tax=Plasmodium ovale wallikeri TaxID=864142 RepID=A0A1A8Z9L6_PLAOA|nr:conserved Plasmodium protein, unknown function [Plasmodium ovale wallikeri]